jgi:hypothetical protein
MVRGLPVSAIVTRGPENVYYYPVEKSSQFHWKYAAKGNANIQIHRVPSDE